MGNRLVIGCGYLGQRVAEKWVQAGHLVTATTRSSEKARQLELSGIKPLQSQILSDENPLPQVDVILFAIGFDRRDPDQSVSSVFLDGLRQTLHRIQPPLSRFIYISSTGVYGSTQSDWVDELTPCNPTREGGKACLAAEQALLDSPLDAHKTRLRLAGIYGPNRIPNQRAILNGEPVAAAGDGYLNLIHVEDAADIVCHIADMESPPELLVVSDGNPPIRADYYAEIARLLGAPTPCLQPPDEHSHAAQRARSSKRVLNNRLMNVYGKPLRYPDFKTGLARELASSP